MAEASFWAKPRSMAPLRSALFEWALPQRSQRIQGYTRAIYSGLTTMALSRIIGEIMETHPNLEGVWQIASAPINKFDLLQELNNRLALGMTIERDDTFICDRSLDGRKFDRETGVRVPSWDTMLSDFAADEVHYQRA